MRLSQVGTGAIVGAVLVLASGTMPALGQSVQLLGEFRDWSAYTAQAGGDKLCFVMSKPVSVEPAIGEMDQPYFYVSHRPGENVRYEVNLISGYEFAPDSQATMRIGSEQYPMFTQSDAAWLEDVSQNSNVAGQIRAGATMVVEGTTARGVKVQQEFSLSGATASMRAMDNECG